MDTNNETPKRRLKDVTPAATIDWTAPGAPAVPVDAYSQYVKACQDRGVLPCSRESFEGEVVQAATSGDAPTELQQICEILYGLPREPDTSDLDEAASRIARIERLTVIPEQEPSTEQEWAKVDPAVAFHLIERHAEDWSDAGRMMEAWRDATTRAASPATASGDELPPMPPTRKIGENNLGMIYGYTADQMRDYARAAVSAATKPTADLSGLKRFGMHMTGDGNFFGAMPDGPYVELADVQSLLATKPAAAPAGRILASVTKEMRAAGLAEANRRDCDADSSDVEMIFNAMLDAAPSASTIGAAQTADQVRKAHPEECWSRDEEDFNHLSLGDLIDSHEDLKPGDTVWIGEAVHPDAAQMVNVDSILENIGEAAYDIGGEHAEDYPDVTAEQAKELERLVVDWLNRSCNTSFWAVTNIKPYVLSADDFATTTQNSEAGDVE